METKLQKIWFVPYKLKQKKTQHLREGVLLKVEFADGKTGHADLHPYPEKGEASLKTHLELLRKKELTALSLRAVAIAREEALALSKGINLLSCLKIPLSHYLIWDLENFSKKSLNCAYHQGFKIFKVKLNHPLRRQSEKLLKLMQETLDLDIKWRWDFHVYLSVQEWEQWRGEYLKKIPLKCLDFIEAPFDYKENRWSEEKKFSLALDVWGGENTLPQAVLVWKIARKSIRALLQKRAKNLFKRVVFTHSLSHPLDQLASAYFSARFYKIHPSLREVCALVQKDIYEQHAFTLPDRGPLFPQLSGPGWGFEPYLLDRLPWKKTF